MRWDFGDAYAVVGPLQGLNAEATSTQGVRLRLQDGHGDLGLRLSGRRIDPQALPRLQLRYRSDQPLQLRLAAAPDLRPQLEGGAPARLPASANEQLFEHPLETLLPPVGPAPLAQLRLWLQGAPGQTLELHSLRLLPSDCGGSPCPPQRFELDAELPSARMLSKRDAIRARHPQALIGAPASEIWVAASAGLRAQGTLPMALLALLVLGAGAALRALVPGRLHACLGLLLGAALPVALLGLGLPRFPDRLGDALLLSALAVALCLARPRNVSTAREPAARAWIPALGFTALGLAGLLLIAALGDTTPRWPPPERWLRYALFALLQQLWLARFALPHLQRLGLGRAAVPAAALLFAGLHLPNLELMALTALAGLAWAALAQRHGRIAPQVISHIVLGLAAVILLPPELLRSAEVGGRFVLAPA